MRAWLAHSEDIPIPAERDACINKSDKLYILCELCTIDVNSALVATQVKQWLGGISTARTRGKCNSANSVDSDKSADCAAANV